MLSEKEVRKEIETIKKLRNNLIEELNKTIADGTEVDIIFMAQQVYAFENQLMILEWVLLDDEDVR